MNSERLRQHWRSFGKSLAVLRMSITAPVGIVLVACLSATANLQEPSASEKHNPIYWFDRLSKKSDSALELKFSWVFESDNLVSSANGDFVFSGENSFMSDAQVRVLMKERGMNVAYRSKYVADSEYFWMVEEYPLTGTKVFRAGLETVADRPDGGRGFWIGGSGATSVVKDILDLPRIAKFDEVVRLPSKNWRMQSELPAEFRERLLPWNEPLPTEISLVWTDEAFLPSELILAAGGKQVYKLELRDVVFLARIDEERFSYTPDPEAEIEVIKPESTDKD